MEKLKKDQVITLYNIVNETESTASLLGSKHQTFVGIYFTETLVKIKGQFRPNIFLFHLVNCSMGLFKQEVKPVARFTVRRLHNNDPITII